jgi:arginine-tRNA-protein transferase
VWRKNQDLVVSISGPKYSSDKLEMYNDYLAFQHEEAEWSSSFDLKRFLYYSPVNTVEFEYRLQHRLVAVGIVDIGSRALSSVYVYFDPEFAGRSLGTFSGLFELDYCRRNGIPFNYFGYYVAESPSMSYKARFAPFELLTDDGKWTQIDKVCGQ